MGLILGTFTLLLVRKDEREPFKKSRGWKREISPLIP